MSIEEEAPAVFDLFRAMNQEILVQEFIDTRRDGGPYWDLRVLVVGDDVYGIRRTAAAGDFRSGLSTNGDPEECSISEELKRKALSISRELDMDICGIRFSPGLLWKFLIP